ncbi:MAG: IclR family transcriptional regulator [Thermodesulfobacteriota bacterium]|nr:IclR family transcriptional regulator [Thermodesulfobacteriota bacterium]MDY6971084.1 IclR family transcriptional regulator [Thermodesulfobacteriota bacterium]
MKSYRKIKSVALSNAVLKFLADQKHPVSGREVAKGVNAKYDTVLCHLATHENDLFVERVGEYFKLGQGAALLWARKQAHLKAVIDKSEDELSELEV